LMSVGVVGVISVSANAYPKLFSEMVHEASNGSYSSASKKHYELHNITKMLFAEGNPGGVKVALEEIGIMKAVMRRPLYPISEGLKSDIIKETKRILG